MGTIFYNPSLFYDQNAVGQAHSAEAMADKESGFVLCQGAKVLEYFILGPRVQRTSGSSRN